ncbi:MAG: glycosyltransferase family 2 protein [Myxococcaceae bacterium]|nr:glycosyltransferase family 2 protein [Myxococcaceae bacterium]MCI0672107.1 glycosyltransferase family 2 protein [Myxococcaceae bacterium]
MAEAAFWVAALLLVHTYFLYPALLVVMERRGWGPRRRGGHSERASHAGGGVLPSVSVVVAAYNEEACIAEKLRNTLALDYPADRFELIIGSDGSSDATDAIVRGCADPRVCLSTAPRAGKTSVLNRCIPCASGDLILLSDANTRVAPDALRKLVRHFEDPEVGAVCGKLRLVNPTREDYEESAYWAYECRIKEAEGRWGAVVGANGGLYAIRRRLFTRLPPSTIVDDLVIGLRILSRGYKVVYDAEAVAEEETTEDYQREFGRRARIAAGNFQSLRLVPSLLNPAAGFPAFAFWSHKVLRWGAPALMAVALVANLLLLHRGAYVATFLAQLAFYLLAYLGRLGVLPGALRRAASAAYYFVSMNAAIVVGFWRFVRKTQQPAWERTARA